MLPHRNFDGHVNRRVREHWVPLFEEINRSFTFENHDHTYKRTAASPRLGTPP